MDAQQATEVLCNGNQNNELDVFEIKYASRAELLKVVTDFYMKKGCALSIRSSRKDRYVTIGCDRGGQYRDRLKIPIEERQRNTKTRLVNCPFEIQGKRDVNFWILEMKNDSHNHELSVDMCGHPSARVLSKAEIARIDQMSRAGITPRQIMSSLRQKNKELKAVARNIYNKKRNLQKESLAGRSSIQVLHEELGEGGFIFDIERDNVGRLTHLFFAHPMSIKLSRSYSNVFLMDCTYKTNRYQMPLLQIIGITSFNTSFCAGFAFLKSEAQTDYEWALKKFSEVLGLSNRPSVIVTDRELALMGAINVVFGEAANFLCVWHIEKNIVAKCKSSFERKEDFDVLLSAWNDVVYSSTEESFIRSWEEFRFSYKHKNDVVNYIEKTWLSHKERFVSAWTEKYPHLGSRATSRVEGAHSKLKKYLLISTGDLRGIKDKMCLLIDNDRQEIRTKLSSERLTIPHKCNIPFFKEVVTRVSSFALGKLHEQYEKLIKNTMTSICTGQFVATMGLPCAHMMLHWKETSIPYEAIHVQWRIDIRSSLLISDEVDDGVDELSGLLSELNEKYKTLPLAEKEETRKKISELVSSSTPLIFEPDVHISKGRPTAGIKRKVSSSTRRDPSAFEYVETSRTSRKCSNCKESGHDRRKCTTKGYIPTGTSSMGNASMFAFDLNMTPYDNHFF